MMFTENQRFTQWWLWTLLLGLDALVLYLLVFTSAADEGRGALVFGVLIMLLLTLLFALFHLKTKISDECIEMNCFPFVRKKVKWSDVESAEVIDYGFVGGWGIRILTSYGTVYNVKGRMGLYIKLKSQKSFLIGTQKADELKSFLEKIKT